jgi:hypothetical protein
MHLADRFLGRNAARLLTVGPRVAVDESRQNFSSVGTSFGGCSVADS